MKLNAQSADFMDTLTFSEHHPETMLSVQDADHSNATDSFSFTFLEVKLPRVS